MNDFVTHLAGKKTHLTTLLIGVLLFGTWQKWWVVPDEIYYGLMGLAITFLRFGVSKSADPDRTSEVEIKKIPHQDVGLPLLAIAAAGAIAAGATGCATRLDPGADPIVVRTEQTLTIAKSTFDLVLNIDHSHRELWREKAPAFHDFCEWLRMPRKLHHLTMPQCSAMLMSLDDVKLDYKTGRATSNDLLTALSTLQGVLNQANAWLTIATNTPQISP